MSNFGWSYPAGCSGTPYDDDPECAVCGGWPDHPDPDSACTCPECEACGAHGDPQCYTSCGMHRDGLQRDGTEGNAGADLLGKAKEQA